MIVLRDQDITVDQQMAFGALFGELSIHPFSPNLADKPEVIILDYSDKNPPALTDIWHVDETFRETPPLATILRAKTVPEVGGDTLFASMSAAYRGLSERMKQHIHGMEALHDFKPWRPLFAHSDRAKLRKLEDDFPNPWHPVVRVHPVSGRRVLYVNQQFCVRIKDLKTDESDTLLHFLYRQATIPEYQLRVKWQPNTLVMWDNRSVQHYAAHDYYPARRTMERVTVKGDRPMGVERRLHARQRGRQRHDEARHRRGHAARSQARLRSLLTWPPRDGARCSAWLRCWRRAPCGPRRRGPASLKIVVPYPPGALTDVLGRLVGERLNAAFGQPVIVDNKAGAATQLGAAYVAKQPPDGYTLLLATVTTLCISPALYAKPLIAFTDFAGAAMLGNVTLILVCRPDLPVGRSAGAGGPAAAASPAPTPTARREPARRTICWSN